MTDIPNEPTANFLLFAYCQLIHQFSFEYKRQFATISCILRSIDGFHRLDHNLDVLVRFE